MTTESLPSPEEVQQTFARMRQAVLDRDEQLTSDVAEAREMLASAERAQAEHRESYPMFFAAAVGRTKPATPEAAVVNRLLRTIGEHPNETTKQLIRRLEISSSWLYRIVAYTNEANGDLIGFSRNGSRGRRYFLTEAGRRSLDHGGIQ